MRSSRGPSRCWPSPTVESVDSIGVTAGNEVFMHVGSGGGAFAGPPLFGRDAFVATHAGNVFLGVRPTPT